jgi:hypothetical protein
MAGVADGDAEGLGLGDGEGLGDGAGVAVGVARGGASEHAESRTNRPIRTPNPLLRITRDSG